MVNGEVERRKRFGNHEVEEAEETGKQVSWEVDALDHRIRRHKDVSAAIEIDDSRHSISRSSFDLSKIGIRIEQARN